LPGRAVDGQRCGAGQAAIGVAADRARRTGKWHQLAAEQLLRGCFRRIRIFQRGSGSGLSEPGGVGSSVSGSCAGVCACCGNTGPIPARSRTTGSTNDRRSTSNAAEPSADINCRRPMLMAILPSSRTTSAPIGKSITAHMTVCETLHSDPMVDLTQRSGSLSEG
jgi:hypothetical protein